MNKLFDRYAAWVVSREKLLVVKGAQAARGLWTLVLVRFFVGLGALWMAMWDDSAWNGLWFPLVGLFVGQAAVAPATKAGSFRNGWLSGRSDMVRKLHESETPNQFVISVLDYDMVHVLGLGVEAPDSPEGLED